MALGLLMQLRWGWGCKPDAIAMSLDAKDMEVSLLSGAGASPALPRSFPERLLRLSLAVKGPGGLLWRLAWRLAVLGWGGVDSGAERGDCEGAHTFGVAACSREGIQCCAACLSHPVGGQQPTDCWQQHRVCLQPIFCTAPSGCYIREGVLKTCASLLAGCSSCACLYMPVAIEATRKS